MQARIEDESRECIIRTNKDVRELCRQRSQLEQARNEI